MIASFGWANHGLKQLKLGQYKFFMDAVFEKAL
jgi:hypothetical protein